jgi:CelD/BcsL family acetyltransferase involved in cellulose biosynthesis
VKLRIVLHRKIPDDAELHRQWNSLVLQTERPEVFYTSEWALAVQSAYQSSLTPLLILGYDGDELIGVAALATDVAGKKISFLASTTGDYCDFLTKPEHRGQFLDAALETIVHLRPRQIVLANLPSDSATVASLPVAAKKHGVHLFSRPAYTCAQVKLDTGEQRKQWKTAVSHKQMLQRKLRALERAGKIDYVHLTSWASIQPVLSTFADSHAARFQEAGRVSSLTTAERRHFLEELARRFSDSGVVTLSVLMLNDQPIAWNFGFRFSGSWFWYQPTFDSRWEQYSPGYCLLARIVVEACDNEEVRIVDLGLGDEGYKVRFANSLRQTLHATLTESWAGHLTEIARYRTASLVKRSPKIESVFRRALGR